MATQLIVEQHYFSGVWRILLLNKEKEEYVFSIDFADQSDAEALADLLKNAIRMEVLV